MRAEKEQLLKDIGEFLNNTGFIYFISYKGLSVSEFSELRTELAKNDSKCHVLKNRLIKKASESYGPEKVTSMELTGDTALVVGSGDPGAVAKVIDQFSKTHEVVVPKVGLLEDEVLSSEDIKAIASLPTREVLLSQLVGVVQAPTRNLVTALHMKLSSIVNVVNAYKNKKEEQ